MNELATIPINLLINEHKVAFKEGKDIDCQSTATQYANFIDITCWIIVEEDGTQLYTLTSTYSMN